METTIRELEKKDNIEEVIKLCFPTLNEEELFCNLNDKNTKTIVAEIDDKVIGYGMYTETTDDLANERIEGLMLLKHLNFKKPNEHLIRLSLEKIKHDPWKSKYGVNIGFYDAAEGFEHFETSYEQPGEPKVNILFARNKVILKPNKLAHLTDLGVIPKYQGKGIAMKLVNERIKRLKGKQIIVEAMEGSPSTIIYSKKLNFTQIAYVKPVFLDGNGSLLMVSQ